jgi:organic hydroperoxide reductase OsmC/OhrA
MTISATLTNSFRKNEITVSTEGNEKNITIPPKPEGFGSSVNGGEQLFLALATCFCNDLYREAVKRKMMIHSVAVTVTGKFGNQGEPATKITYKVKVEAPNNTEKEIIGLITFVDSVAEVHNTLRKGVNVDLIK